MVPCREDCSCRVATKKAQTRWRYCLECHTSEGTPERQVGSDLKLVGDTPTSTAFAPTATYEIFQRQGPCCDYTLTRQD